MRHNLARCRQYASEAHQLSLFLDELSQFVRVVHSYIMIGIVSTGWRKLCAALRGARSVDTLRHALDRYLHELLAHCWLEGGKHSAVVLQAVCRALDHALRFAAM